MYLLCKNVFNRSVLKLKAQNILGLEKFSKIFKNVIAKKECIVFMIHRK